MVRRFLVPNEQKIDFRLYRAMIGNYLLVNEKSSNQSAKFGQGTNSISLQFSSLCIPLFTLPNFPYGYRMAAAVLGLAFIYHIVKKKKRSTFLFHLLKTKSLTSLALDQARCWDHGWASHSAGRMLCADWFMLLSLTPEAGEVVVMLTEALITIHGCCTMRTISTFTHRNQDMIPCALALNALIQLSFPNCTEVWWDVCQG